MNTRHHGSCLCGEVRFEFDGRFEGFFLCHCQYCRKDTGSAHAANLFSTSANLTWLSGQDKRTQYHLPSTRHVRCFCSVCGSALPYTRSEAPYLVVPAGSLDSAVDIQPTAHIFVSSRANWDHELEQVPCFEKLPQ